MTTETTRVRWDRSRPVGPGILAAAAAAALTVGGSLTVVAGVAAGSAAALGVLAGTGLAVAVFALGSSAVYLVAGLLPAASLLVAVLTYTLQVVLMWLVFVGLSRSGALEGTLDAAWLAAGVIAATVVWVGAQLLLATRARIPAYDLPSPAPADRAPADPPEAGAQ